ncbi:MAG: sulfotransferase domain-containing protein [Actinobacteria bacterium]|nr:MAG: sulfotransferase domain-containing protein [Actinomycetota bacterium]
MDQARARAGTVPVEGLTADGTSVPPTASKDTANAGRGLPRSVRRPMAAARLFLRRPTASLRATPDFLIVGAQRAGTTSLYRYLAEHPAVAPPIRKEIQYFSLHHGRGDQWYRSHFPVAGRDRRTFEATPYYLLHPAAPARAAATVPEAKVIALVRDPVARAFSQWQHNASRGLEHLGFEAALDAEPERLAGEEERLVADATYRSDAHRLWSYMARGRYSDQLERWLAHYPRERILVLRSEDLYEQPASTYARSLEFLGLPAIDLEAYPRYTRRPSTAHMTDGARHRLAVYFRPHNERLAALLGENVWWESA